MWLVLPFILSLFSVVIVTLIQFDLLSAEDFFENIYFINFPLCVLQINMEGRGGVRPSLDFQMIFAFNAMVYFDFFQNTWETRHAFWQKKKRKK